MKIDKIIILGGGSAGWMTAATLIKAFPNKDISVIESAKVPVIGVGESTLGFINHWLDFLEIKLDISFEYVKLGICRFFVKMSFEIIN